MLLEGKSEKDVQTRVVHVGRDVVWGNGAIVTVVRPMVVDWRVWMYHLVSMVGDVRLVAQVDTVRCRRRAIGMHPAIALFLLNSFYRTTSEGAIELADEHHGRGSQSELQGARTRSMENRHRSRVCTFSSLSVRVQFKISFFIFLFEVGEKMRMTVRQYPESEMW